MTSNLNTNSEFELIVTILSNKSILNISTDIDWTYFVKLVIRHRVIEQIYVRLKFEINVPDEILQRLEKMCHQQRLRLLMTSAETLRISRELTKHGIPYAVVKGISVSVLAYGGITKRQCKDIDLWVDLVNFDKAISVVKACGYQQTRPEYELIGFKRDYYLNHNHDFEFFNPDKKVQLELMFKVSYLGVDFPNLSDVPLRVVEINQNSLVSIDDDYHLLLLIVHGAIHAWHRLRWLLDIYLLFCLGKVDLPRLLSLSDEFRCRHMVIQCLWLLERVFNLNNNELESQLAEINKKDLRMSRLLLEFVRADYELSGTHGIFNKMFYKYRWYLTQITPPPKRWKIICEDLFKIDNTFKTLSLPSGWGFGYYLFYPLCVLKYIFCRKF